MKTGEAFRIDHLRNGMDNIRASRVFLSPNRCLKEIIVEITVNEF